MSDAPKVLLADDDPAIRPLITAICKRIGFVCDSAPDGEVALEMIRSAEYDIVVLDLMMPKVNGYQVIEALRELPLRPAVIVLTAQGARQMQDVADVTVVHAVKAKRPSDALGRDTVAVERDMDGCCAPLLLRDTTGMAKC